MPETSPRHEHVTHRRTAQTPAGTPPIHPHAGSRIAPPVNLPPRSLVHDYDCPEYPEPSKHKPEAQPAERDVRLEPRRAERGQEAVVRNDALRRALYHSRRRGLDVCKVPCHSPPNRDGEPVRAVVWVASMTGPAELSMPSTSGRDPEGAGGEPRVVDHWMDRSLTTTPPRCCTTGAARAPSLSRRSVPAQKRRAWGGRQACRAGGVQGQHCKVSFLSLSPRRAFCWMATRV